jgi:hypothetical protein
MNDEIPSQDVDMWGGAETSANEPFAVKDCALLVVATARRAENLKELRDNLLTSALTASTTISGAGFCSPGS